MTLENSDVEVGTRYDRTPVYMQAFSELYIKCLCAQGGGVDWPPIYASCCMGRRMSLLVTH